MTRRATIAILMTMLLAAGAGRCWAGVGAEAAQKLYERVSPSLVAVQYTWDSEMGRREIIGAGVVVGEDGLIMAPMAIFDLRIPDEQMKDFRIIVPNLTDEDEELDAILVGRDERSNVAFVKASSPRKWTAVKFEDAPIKVGDTVLSVGLLPQMAGYRAYFAEAAVAATLRGEIRQILVGGGLTSVGSPVFNAEGKAIGFVNAQPEQPVFLNDGKNAMAGILSPPKFFVPARDFLPSLQDPPVAGQPQKLPWLGLPALAGLRKDVAEFFGLKGQTAVEVGDIIPGSPAERAGMRRGQIIVKLDGQPLERGDEPDEAAQILRRKLLRRKVGQQVTLAVLEKKDQPLRDLSIVLEERPKQQNLAARFFAEDLGFTAREVVFTDTYMRRLPADAKGVVIAWVKPQGSAQNGHLQNNDLVTEINSSPVTTLEQFRKSYEEFRKLRPADAVVMVVLREGNTEVIRIEPPQ